MTFASPAIMPLPPADTDAPDWQITAAGTYTGAWVEDLAGLERAGFTLRLAYGTGGATIKACLQSSLDQGNTAYDVAIINFTTAARNVIGGVRDDGTSTLVDAGEGGLAAGGGPEAEGIVTSVLGDRMRLKLIVTGTYANTVLSGRLHPR